MTGQLEVDDEKADTAVAKADLALLRVDSPVGKGAAPRSKSASARWKSAVAKALAVPDPWAKFHLEESPVKLVRRHRFLVKDSVGSPAGSPRTVDVMSDSASLKPLSGEWISDWALVKMETKPFASGAMRNCFRMKKYPQVPGGPLKCLDWKKAPNYVSKQYKTEEASFRYFVDVELQQQAHYWARMFNMREPPKKIDMIRAFLIQVADGTPEQIELAEASWKSKASASLMSESEGIYKSAFSEEVRYLKGLEDSSFDRVRVPSDGLELAGKLFAVERFIDGPYVKHNSNSGFVEEELHRMTPQAFSHFTFEASGGEELVVDIQGVDDLYTDPQIHSRDCRFGAGDFSYRGMALFFAHHKCNYVCEKIGLSDFHAKPLTLTAELLNYLKPVSSHSKKVAVANVHLSLAKIYAEGRLSATRRDPDPKKCAHHLHQAAAHGSKEALLALAQMYVGEVCETFDPASSEIKVDSESDLSKALWATAARYGCLEAVGRTAASLADSSNWNEVLILLSPVFESDEKYSDSDWESSTVPRHALRRLLGQAQRNLGFLSVAAANLEKAGSEAMRNGDICLANKCFDELALIEA